MRNKLFFELLQVALGARGMLSRVPSEEEWREMMRLCLKHALGGVGFYAMHKMAEEGAECAPGGELLVDMYGLNFRLKQRNDRAVADILNLTRILEAEGFESCVLKGQGLALLYPKGMERAAGDIDIWVAKRGEWHSLDRRRKEIVALCRGVVGRMPVFYHHTKMPLKGRDIEVHFTPSWMNCPWHNARLQAFFDEEWRRRRFVDGVGMPVHDRELAAKGFHIPSMEMDAVFVLLHMYRHVFSEGVGLRQVLDYYLVLQQEGLDRERVMKVLASVGLDGFAGAMMWVLREVMAMQREDMLCVPDERRGRFLLREIMLAGNFGRYDERLSGVDRSSLWSRFVENMHRNLRLVRFYPAEALWAPLWKVWQKVVFKG